MALEIARWDQSIITFATKSKWQLEETRTSEKDVKQCFKVKRSRFTQYGKSISIQQIHQEETHRDRLRSELTQADILGLF